jgi:beta-lactam-binding protein with PASTA domain
MFLSPKHLRLAQCLSVGRRRSCTVPNVRGRTLAGAGERISHHHCSLGGVGYAFSRKVLKGRVISQDPAAGWQNEQGVNAMVNLVISKGRRKSSTAGRKHHSKT